ncbi:hypothetical protein Ae201684_018409 [Aphanomyces euteiches]|uniref:Uncharacterized protein n=1 Tax=Aphanomyces euteiches TaxID=100861 RepID=A0A6G0W5W4_9STRA|nr:hypothetical protein Ae201684_018409 [Aphanomyces euteiches]
MTIMTWTRVGVAVAVAVASVADAACSYSSLPSYVYGVVVSDKTLCPAVNATCVVNKNTCALVGTGDPSVVDWNAIGSYLDAPTKWYSWDFSGAFSVLNMDLMVFPNRFSELYDGRAPANVYQYLHPKWNSISTVADQLVAIDFSSQQPQDNHNFISTSIQA